jgi:hypothetical protein
MDENTRLIFRALAFLIKTQIYQSPYIKPTMGRTNKDIEEAAKILFLIKEQEKYG